MAMDPLGSEQYTDADRIGMTVNVVGNQGDAVAVTGDLTVSPVATAGGNVHGVLREDADDGDKAGVHLHGAFWCNVAAGTTAGSYLTGSATAGQLRGINTGGATGESEQTKTLLALTSEADGQALVLFQ